MTLIEKMKESFEKNGHGLIDIGKDEVLEARKLIDADLAEDGPTFDVVTHHVTLNHHIS